VNGYNFDSDACDYGTVGLDVYLAPPDGPSIIGKTIYTNSNLGPTTIYLGDNKWHLISDDYAVYRSVQISNLGVIYGSIDCVAPTPTPTISVTPTNTPTISVTPTNTITPTITSSVTPTNTMTPTITTSITPTVTPTKLAVIFLTDVTDYVTSAEACNGTAGTNKYLAPATSQPIVNQYVYDDAGLTSPYNGNISWHLMSSSPTNNWAVLIDADGVIMTVSPC
tara:strand:+ start:191 stop:859 length:669 start_codon:yes stop_codon:yes gene_type:complete